MKKMCLLFVFGLFVSVFAFAGEKASVTGWLSDAKCGANAAKAMSADHQGCATSCVKGGGKWVLVESKTHKVIPIHNQDAVKESHVGHEVTVKGSMEDEDGLHVESIEASS